MQAAIPTPLASMNHDPVTLAAHIRCLPEIRPEFFLGVADAVRRAKNHLACATDVRELLCMLLEYDPTNSITAITLERFQMHCPSNSEMFACITRDERASGPLSRSHYFNVMGTQTPTLDRSTGLECLAPARSVYGSHDLWQRSTHEGWEFYPRLYGATAGAGWLTVLLQRRCSHTHKSSQKGYSWALNIDYTDDGRVRSTRVKGSVGHELARYFDLTRDSLEESLSRLRVHAADHALASIYDDVESSAGVIVHDGRRILAANRASERVFASLLPGPLSETTILQWLAGARSDDIRSLRTTDNGDHIVVVSRALSSITTVDWSGPTTLVPFPSDARDRVKLHQFAESGVGVVIDAVDKIGCSCLFLPFQNHVGVGVDARGCHAIPSTQFQKLPQPDLIALLARARETPVLIMKRASPVAIIIADL